MIEISHDSIAGNSNSNGSDKGNTTVHGNDDDSDDKNTAGDDSDGDDDDDDDDGGGDNNSNNSDNGFPKFPTTNAKGFPCDIVNENDGRLRYTGTWVLESKDPNGIYFTTHTTSTAGSAVTISFNGTSKDFCSSYSPHASLCRHQHYYHRHSPC